MVSETLAAFKRTLELPEFREYPRCGIVLQAYLRRTADDLDQLIVWAKKRGVPVGSLPPVSIWADVIELDEGRM